jgi:tetratricopeptide (TPR) repeat protein
VIVNEFRPYFYERYANIRAIQYDICNKAERFWATSDAAANTLRLDGIPAESVGRINPVVDTRRFAYDVKLRAKFRDYVGIGHDEFVVLFQDELEAWHRPEELVKAMSLVKQRCPAGKRLRLLFAATGGATMELKYGAYDLKLGKSVMFLHQNTEPFLVDMYAACDAVFVPRSTATDLHEEIPLPMLEAMACGVVPIVTAGSIAAEMAGYGGVVVPDDGHAHVAAALQTLLQDQALAKRLRERAQTKVQTENAGEASIADFVAGIEALLRTTPVSPTAPRDLSHTLAEVDAELRRGGERDALVKIEEALLLTPMSASTRADLLCRKGEAFYALADYEPATAAFDEALKLVDRHPRVLRGLGFVSWQGHANEEALAFFRKALALQGDDAMTMFGIGLVYRRLGLLEEAMFWLEKCVTRDDAPAAALIAIAQSCAQVSDPQTGIDVMERLVDVIGEHQTLMVTLGQLYLNQGRVEEGNAILAKALAAKNPPAA